MSSPPSSSAATASAGGAATGLAPASQAQSLPSCTLQLRWLKSDLRRLRLPQYVPRLCQLQVSRVRVLQPIPQRMDAVELVVALRTPPSTRRTLRSSKVLAPHAVLAAMAAVGPGGSGAAGSTTPLPGSVGGPGMASVAASSASGLSGAMPTTAAAQAAAAAAGSFTASAANPSGGPISSSSVASLRAAGSPSSMLSPSSSSNLAGMGPADLINSATAFSFAIQYCHHLSSDLNVLQLTVVRRRRRTRQLAAIGTLAISLNESLQYVVNKQVLLYPVRRKADTPAMCALDIQLSTIPIHDEFTKQIQNDMYDIRDDGNLSDEEDDGHDDLMPKSMNPKQTSPIPTTTKRSGLASKFSSLWTPRRRRQQSASSQNQPEEDGAESDDEDMDTTNPRRISNPDSASSGEGEDDPEAFALDELLASDGSD